MGYYTNFSLLVNNKPNEEHEEAIGQSSEYESNVFEDSIKWYGYMKDMTNYSKLYPDDIFELHGKGEDGYLWVAYFKNGKSVQHEAEITYPEFNESELQ